jgi:hypothetical protein
MGVEMFLSREYRREHMRSVTVLLFLCQMIKE